VIDPDEHDARDEEASIGAPIERALRRQPLSSRGHSLGCEVAVAGGAQGERHAEQRCGVSGTESLPLAACLGVLAVTAIIAFRPTEPGELVGSDRARAG
jgi:hypothetical protein